MRGTYGASRRVSLFRHVCSSTKQRGTLTGLGIAALTFDISDFRWEELAKSLPELFARGEKRGRELIAALLTVFAQKGAIAFPEPLTARDVLRFGARSVEVYSFHRTQSGTQPGHQVLRWNPYLAPTRSRKNAIRLSRQLRLLVRALELDRVADEATLAPARYALGSVHRGRAVSRVRRLAVAFSPRSRSRPAHHALAVFRLQCLRAAHTRRRARLLRLS